MDMRIAIHEHSVTLSMALTPPPDGKPASMTFSGMPIFRRASLRPSMATVPSVRPANSGAVVGSLSLVTSCIAERTAPAAKLSSPVTLSTAPTTMASSFSVFATMHWASSACIAFARGDVWLLFTILSMMPRSTTSQFVTVVGCMAQVRARSDGVWFPASFAFMALAVKFVRASRSSSSALMLTESSSCLDRWRSSRARSSSIWAEAMIERFT